MAKFYGKIGFGIEDEVRPGVWSGVTERTYRGDVIHTINRPHIGQEVNESVDVRNQISIVSDPFAVNNFASIRYVEWLNTKWEVTSAELKYPRIELNLGGVYNERPIEFT